jgi:predicted permease
LVFAGRPARWLSPVAFQYEVVILVWETHMSPAERMIRCLRRTFNRLRGSLVGGRSDRDLADELDAHLRLLADEDIRRGVPPEVAYRRARLRFGSIESAKERYRDQRGLPFLDTLIQDVRYAWCGMRRNPGFAAVAILSLAIGIGANTAIFSLVNGVLLRPLSYAEPDRVYAVREIRLPQAAPGSRAANPMHARAWGAQCPSLESVGLIRGGRAQVAAGGEPASIPSADVSANLFTLLGVRPILGRAFLAAEEEEGGARVVILSESLWHARFNGDRALVGQPIPIDGLPHHLIGIMPAWFRLPSGDGGAAQRVEIFRPLVLSQQEQSRLMGNYNYSAVARLRRGVTSEQALAEIDVVQARIVAQAGSRGGLRAELTPIHEIVTGRARVGLWMLAAAVGAVLLIVCLNLANLFLSRVASRSREAAIRTALGASRGRQFRQLLTESLVLAGAGGALGLLFAWQLVQLFVATTSVDIPRLDEVRLDGRVLAFAFGATLASGLVFGALPASRLTRSDPQDALRSGSHTTTEGRGFRRLREGLIGLEVGLSATLLIVAGLLTASLTRLLGVDKGFDVEHVLTLDIDLSGARHREDAGRERFFDRVLASVEAIPGVEASGIVTTLPIAGGSWNDPIYHEGAARPFEERYLVNNRYASPGYFRAMNIAFRYGRGFDTRDRGQSVAVLSEKAARVLWPNEPNPVGRRFMGEDDTVKTLVGIVAEVRATLEREPPPTAYYPYWQLVPDGATLAVRTAVDPSTVAGALRVALRNEDAELPILTLRTMEQVLDRAVAERRFQSMLAMALGASALLVASLGIYGVVAYSVARRRNEIGIRLALGAQRSQLLGLVLVQGMAPVVLGLGAGIATALLVGRAIRGLLFEVQPTDPMTIAGVAVLLLVVGVLACLVPARRAAGTDAIAALRLE